MAGSNLLPIAVAALGGAALMVLVALCLAVLGYLLLQKKRGMALFMAAAVIGGFILSSTLKLFFDRPRPDIVPHSAYVMSASFPSGHSMLSAVVFLTLGGLLARYIKNRRLKIYVLTLSVLATFIVGCSRVYLGVHCGPPMSWPAGRRAPPGRCCAGPGRSCSRDAAVWRQFPLDNLSAALMLSLVFFLSRERRNLA